MDEINKSFDHLFMRFDKQAEQEQETQDKLDKLSELIEVLCEGIK